jgi:hypothetical protein
MTLNYFEINQLGAYIIDAWQNQLQTEADPTSGKWYRNGPNNTLGLVGGLTDQLITDLSISPDQQKFNQTKEIAASTTLDNRQGLLDNTPATQTLEWTITNTSTATHQTSNSIKSGISDKLTFKGKVGSVEISNETTISIEYQYSWADSQSNSLTDSKKFSTSIPFKAPTGKVIKLIVMADTLDLSIPYSAQILLSGQSDANFSQPVQESTFFSANAGTLCSWIKKYGSAKNDGLSFDVDQSDPSRGIAAMTGTLRAKQSVNFTVFAVDITSSYSSDPTSQSLLNNILSGKPTKEVLNAIPVAIAQ